jgi:hypothetical protein
MKVRKVPIVAKLSVIAVAAMSAVFLGAAPASAAGIDYGNDGWYIMTSNGCGQADFIDYGEGLSGGGMNDDYVTIEDYCSDGHGVKAWAWLTRNGVKYYLGGAYDGYGNFSRNGVYEVWDPFKDYGNVQAGDYVGLKVCLVDGDSDPTPSYCYSETHRSSDG